MACKAGSRSCWTASGSRSWMSANASLRSAKSTVTCLRSPSRVVRAVRMFSTRAVGVHTSSACSGAVPRIRSPAGTGGSSARVVSGGSLTVTGARKRYPIHIKLRLSSRSGRIEQQLIGVWVFFAPIHPAPRSEAALDRCDGANQTWEAAKTARQVQGVFLDCLRGFRPAAVGIGPQADQEDPMLDEHRQELRIHLTQDAPGFGAARLVHVALTLPQLEEQLDRKSVV